MSITWITLMSLILLVIMFWTHVWSLVSSFEEPQVRPFSCQEVGYIGTSNQNAGAAAQLVPCGLVM